MKSVFVFPPLRKHLTGGHDQSSHGSWAGFTFEEETTYSGTTLSMKDKNGKTLAVANYTKLTTDLDINQIDSYDEGKGYATKLLTKIYDSFPNSIIFWGKTISPASTHLAEKFNSNYGRTSYIPWGYGATGDKEWGEEYGQREPIKKHQAGQHDQTTHGSWATANGYKLASEEDLPALQSMNYDSTVRYARDNYIARGYKWMNEYLRDGYIADTVEGLEYESEPISKEEAIGLIDSLKSALYETQTTQDLTVTRWTRTGESIIGEKISEVSNLKSLIGKTYHAKGFTSTSVEPDSSTTDGYKSVSKVLANIHMPAGTYGATVYNSRESEFLLAPDTFFVVMGASNLGEGRISLDLLVTGQGDG